MKVAFIKWLDAASEYQVWYTGGELDVRRVIYSTGMLIHKNKEVVTLAADYDPKGGHYRDVTSIPVSCILEEKYFKVKKK
jgi:hypothetical protein